MSRFWLLLLLLPGCAVTGSRPATVACQIADTASTIQVIDAGGHEANPLLPSNRNGIIAVKVVLTGLLLWFHDSISKEAHTFINAITCGAAVHNRRVLKEQRELNSQ